MPRQSLFAAATLAALLAGGAADGDPLAAHQWRSRVLVLSAPGAEDKTLRAQREALASARTRLRERDLVVLEAVGSSADAVRLRRRLGLSAEAFHAVLVGKDGGVKLSSQEPIPPQTLFSTIDAMPMRRDEMRRR
ncbi:DUF4174 domain-containing protein [Methylobacterium organophilum]|uniref:DUF4174 domain-containing protein n=1 Tax=Methylobacterium organophilum TaxID=410 RepID=UPI001F13D94E|nr:DUF4174 domain-containing protein [Methylobacterium organophilum]UMY18406.1 DUF4174 domain-containing protein [Methylobacterium organophilum]